jgi:hypothetical protein
MTLMMDMGVYDPLLDLRLATIMRQASCFNSSRLIVTGIEFKAALLTGHNVLVAQPECRASRRMGTLVAIKYELLLRHLHMHDIGLSSIQSRQAAPSFDE